MANVHHILRIDIVNALRMKILRIINLKHFICIATDGIMPIAKGDVEGVDNFLFEGNEEYVNATINTEKQSFFDDITLGIFGGKG